MFAQGHFEVAQDKFDAAYAGSLSRVVNQVEKHTPERAASRAAKERSFRALRVRLKENRSRFIPVREMLASLFEDGFLILMEGRTTSAQAFQELPSAVAIDELLVNPATGKKTEALQTELVAELLPHVSVGALVSRARRTPQSTLRQGRDEALAFRELGRAYGGFIKRVWGWRRAFPWLLLGSVSDVALAYAAPMMSWIRERYGDQYDQFLAECPQWISKFTASNALLDFLPDDFQWRPGVWEKHTPDQAARLRQLLRRFAHEQPGYWAALHSGD